MRNQLFIALVIGLVLGGAGYYSLKSSRKVAELVLTQWKKVPLDANSLVDAVHTENVEVLLLFFQAGFDVNQPNKAKQTALGVAIAEGKPEFAEALVKHGAKLTADDLVEAARIGNIEILELFFQAKFDLNQPNKAKQTALAVAVRDLKLLIADALLKHGAKPNVLSGGQTPLSIAASLNTPLETELLLAKGADPNVPDFLGETPIFSAVRAGLKHQVALLLKAKANVNLAGKLGGTPLLAATESGNLEIMEMLLAAGARVDDADKSGTTALELALYAGNEQAVDLLLRHKASTQGKDLLFAAVTSRKLPLVRLVAGFKPDINRKGVVAWKEEGTAADLAARLDEPEIFSFLVSRGAKPLNGYAYSKLRGASPSLRPNFNEPKQVKGFIKQLLPQEAINEHVPEVYRPSVKALYRVGGPQPGWLATTTSSFKETAGIDLKVVEIEVFSGVKPGDPLWLELPGKLELDKILARIAAASDALVSSYLQEEFSVFAPKAGELVASKRSKLSVHDGALLLADLYVARHLYAQPLKSLTHLVNCSLAPALAPADWTSEMTTIWIPAADAVSVRPTEEASRHCMNLASGTDNAALLKCLCPVSARQEMSGDAKGKLDEKIAAAMRANPRLFKQKTGSTGKRPVPGQKRR